MRIAVNLETERPLNPGVREAISRLAPGVHVGHANPELADWAGIVTVNSRGNWFLRRFGGDVYVTWNAGTVPSGKLPVPGFIEATALTIAGECPDCARPAHLLFAGNAWQRSEGWHHDSPADSRTCWAGKAAFEAGRI